MIRSPGEYAVFAKRRDAALFKWLAVGLQQALREVISMVRKAAPVQTGNLQASVGVNHRVAASKTNLGLRASPMKTLVKKAVGKFVALLPIGMAYAPDVDKRTGFASETVEGGAAKKTFAFYTNEAMEQAAREIGA